MKKYLYSALPFALVFGIEASNVSYVEHMEIRAGEGELVAIGPGCTIFTVPEQEHDSSSSIEAALSLADKFEAQNEINERIRITRQKINMAFHEATGHWLDEYLPKLLSRQCDSSAFQIIDDDRGRLAIVEVMLANIHNGNCPIPRKVYPWLPDLFNSPELIKFNLALAFAQYDIVEGMEVAIKEGWAIHSESLESMKRDARNERNREEEVTDLQASMMYFLIRSMKTYHSDTKVLDYLLNLYPEMGFFTVKSMPLLSLAFHYGDMESVTYLSKKGFDLNSGFPKGFQPISHNQHNHIIFPLMAASLRECMSSIHMDFLIAHHVDLFQTLSLADSMTLAVVRSALQGGGSCDEIAEINAPAALSIRGMSYMFGKLMEQKEFNAANSLPIVAGVMLKNQKRFPVWLNWWEQGNAGIPNQLVEMGILKLSDYRNDIDRFFEFGDFSMWDLIEEATGKNTISQISQQNTSSNSTNPQQESPQNSNTTDITAEITAQNTPKKSTGKEKKEEKKEEKSAMETEKEIRQQSKQEVAGWLIEHDFQLSQKNVPGFLAVELFRELHASVTKTDLPGVQKRIKQGGDAIGDILNFQLGSGTTLIDIADLLASEEDFSAPKKGGKQKKQSANRNISKNPPLKAGIEIKKALESAMAKENPNTQKPTMLMNEGNSENIEKEDAKNEDLEQNKENTAQSAIKSNEKTDEVTIKATPKSELEVQTSKIEAKTSKKTAPQSSQAEPEKTTQTESKTFKAKSKATKIESPKSKKELSYQRKEEKRKKEQKEQEKLERERQERQKALENQQKAEKKVEKTEKFEKVEKVEETEKTELMEETKKPAKQEQKGQKIEKTSKNFQRNLSQKQEFPRSPSRDFEKVSEGKGKSIKIKAIPLPEDIMGTKIDKEIQTPELELLQQRSNAKIDEQTQTPRLRQRQINRANPPRLQFFHDDTFNVSVGPTPPIPPKNKTLQNAPAVSIFPDLWDSRKFLDQETYRIFEEELKKPNPDFTLIAPNEQNILHYYARFGKIGEIENLYATHPDTFKQLLNSSDIGGWTALHLAVKYGHGEIIQFLVQHGAADFIVKSARDFAYSCYRNMFFYFGE